MDRLRCTWLLLSLVSITSAGCCCVQGVPSSGNCGVGACSTGGCGPGPLASLISCRGACGDVYVDEWISEPPTVDNCGYDCGGCGRCGNCRPIRSVLKLLWGRPYMSSCSTGLCGPSCDGGCGNNVAYESIGGQGYSGEFGSGGSSCNCGGDHSSHATITSSPQPIPGPAPDVFSPETVAPEIPMETAPQVVPTPAPIAPTSAKRLNPARRYQKVRRVSANR